MIRNRNHKITATRNPSSAPSSLVGTVKSRRHRRFAIAWPGTVVLLLALAGATLYWKHNTVPSTLSDDRPAPLPPGVCRYDGHCPVGSTCAVSNNRKLGTCTPLLLRNGPDSGVSAEKSCVQACLKELQVDEHFYHSKWPLVKWSEDIESEGRPTGCVLGFQREPEGDRWTERIAQGEDDFLKYWMDNRFRHIIRVDPYRPDDENDDHWIAYCYSPCQSNQDCNTARDISGKPAFVCDKGACQRNPIYWEADIAKTREMVLVSGATTHYFKALVNLAASARYWAPHNKMVVYNLGGLDDNQKKEILSWPNVIALEWPDGVPPEYPPHVKIGKQYAWKPVILNESVHKYRSIFWLDAGTTLAGPFTPVEDIVQRTGMFLVKGQDLDMKGKSHPGTYSWFNVSKETFEAGPHFGGGTQAHMLPSRYVDLVVKPNAQCAVISECIMPDGSSLVNHRYDQTSVSILGYLPKVKAPHYTEYVAASSRQLNANLKLPSTRFIWTARGSCHFYSDQVKPGESFPG